MFPGALAMSEPVAALEQRIDHLEPKQFRHAALQTFGALGLAAFGAGARLTLAAPAVPAHAAASSMPVQPAATPRPPGLPSTAVTTDVARASAPTPVQLTPDEMSPKPAPQPDSSGASPDKEVNMKKSTSIAVTVA